MKKQRSKKVTLIVMQKYDAEDFYCRGVRSGDLITYDPANETPVQAVKRIYPDRDFERNFLVIGEIDGDYEELARKVWMSVNANHDDRERLQEAEYNARQKPPQTDTQLATLEEAIYKLTFALVQLVISVLLSILNKNAGDIEFKTAEVPLPTPRPSAKFTDDPDKGFIEDEEEEEEEDNSPRPGM